MAKIIAGVNAGSLPAIFPDCRRFSVVLTPKARKKICRLSKAIYLFKQEIFLLHKKILTRCQKRVKITANKNYLNLQL